MNRRGQEELDRSFRYYANDRIPTCRMAWMDAGDGPFGSRAMPENKGMARSPVGHQRGTYFRTSKTRLDLSICPEPMTVWRWGGRDRDDIRSGAWNGCL
jgi:hypothetical protein